jgi:hypothetical protein
VLRLELPLPDLTGTDGDLPELEIEVLLEGGAEMSAPVALVGDWARIGELGPLKWPPKSNEGMSVTSS